MANFATPFNVTFISSFHSTLYKPDDKTLLNKAAHQNEEEFCHRKK